MYLWINLCAIFIASATAASPSTTKQYRDYTYNKKTDAFYKLHIEGALEWRARTICAAEGAQLMRPEGNPDIVQAHAMFKRFPDLGNYLMIETDGEPHESAEETPMVKLEETQPDAGYEARTVEAMNRNGEVETYWNAYQELPFICKVAAKDAPYNVECDVYSSDYVSKISTTGSCYRIARVQANWNEAYAACEADGAHLAVLNNEEEFYTVKQMLLNTPRMTEPWQFFVGVRAEKTEPRIFKTVMNQTLEEVGYQPWAPNEPNNEFGVEYCVSMLRSSGLYNDTVCRNRYSYVCEKERRV